MIVSGYLERYLDIHGRGPQGSTFVIFGDSLSVEDKKNLKLCKDCGFDVKHWSEFAELFLNFLVEVADEADVLPRDKRERAEKLIADLQSKIKIR